MPQFQGPGGVSSGYDFKVVPRPDIRQVRREIRRLDPEQAGELKKRLKAANKHAADMIAAAAQAKAEALGGIHRRAAPQIKGSNVEKGIRIRVANSKKVPFAVAALWGRKGRSGWYLDWTLHMKDLGHPTDGGPQFPKWVGATWEPGVKGQGPYAVNDAIAEKRDEIVEQWTRAIERLAADLNI